MQVARYWRMKAQNYRLQGVRYENGEISLQARPVVPGMNNNQSDDQPEQEFEYETQEVEQISVW